MTGKPKASAQPFALDIAPAAARNPDCGPAHSAHPAVGKGDIPVQRAPTDFVAAGVYRHLARDTDPPRV
jgi:catalase